MPAQAALDRPIAIGCMRLSTAPDRDDTRSIAVLHAAFDAGITLLDTADAYCRDASETGHNERLIARALATWPGDRSAIRVATKGGLTRPDGRWQRDGRARSLTAACEASRRALGVDRIDLYQLHAVDPRVSLTTSVRALDALRRRGAIEAIGLCNVTVGQIEEARRITDIASVQVELGLWQDANVLSGVLDYCVAHAIPLLAYRPLGGPEPRRRLETDPALVQLARQHGATPFEIGLAALADLSPIVRPLPGPTRVETVRSVARAATLTLTDGDRALLHGRFPVFRSMKPAASPTVPSRVEPGSEVVLLMGLPGAGKSTLAESLVGEGYLRVNRDEAGGSLDALLPVLDRALASGVARVVLDNTYVTRKSRAVVIQVAARHGVPVRCLWLSASIEDAQVNAVSRMMAKYGRLLPPEEMRAASRRDVSVFPPAVQFRYQRELEPPHQSEGFSRIDVVPFARQPAGIAIDRAVILWCDGVLQRSREGRRTPLAPDDVEAFAARGELLRRYAGDGWKVLGLTWLPEIAEGTMSPAAAEAVFARLREGLGVAIEIEYCPHAAGPPVCWCRKPLPGLGVLFQQRHHLDPARCLYVGAGAQDPGFARRMGFQYRDASAFFATSATG